MSQWSTEYRTQMAVYLAEIGGPPFMPVTPESPIEIIVMIRAIGDRGQALAELEEIRQRYTGQPYSRWPGMRNGKPYEACK